MHNNAQQSVIYIASIFCLAHMANLNIRAGVTVVIGSEGLKDRTNTLVSFKGIFVICTAGSARTKNKTLVLLADIQHS